MTSLSAGHCTLFKMQASTKDKKEVHRSLTRMPTLMYSVKSNTFYLPCYLQDCAMGRHDI